MLDFHVTTVLLFSPHLRGDAMAQTIYTRQKQAGNWRFFSVEEGPGKKTGDLRPPFYVRHMAVNRRGKRAQMWRRLEAQSLKEAKFETAHLADALDAESKGLTVLEAQQITNSNRVPLSVAAEQYLEQTSKKSRSTVLQYRTAIGELVELLDRKVRFMDEITVDSLRFYKARMEEQGYESRTIDTRLTIVYAMLKKNGVTVRLPRDERPVWDEEPAQPYSDTDIENLFNAVKKDPDATAVYKFFLGTGCREAEVTFASWTDLNLDRGTFTVRSKQDMGFKVKNHESRTIPLPKSLIRMLRERREHAPHQRWIFVNEKGGPDKHFLPKLKKIALRAGLNCGQCERTLLVGKYDRKKTKVFSCKDRPICEHWILHRLRKTCATRWHESGVPARTIQHWLGHKKLDTTMTYLGVTDAEKLQDNINKAFGD
jgi:integrase/recombinase XerD